MYGPDLKLHLATTSYGNFLQNEASPLAVSTIDDKLKEKLVGEFNHIRNQCVQPLSEFLDYITYVCQRVCVNPLIGFQNSGSEIPIFLRLGCFCMYSCVCMCVRRYSYMIDNVILLITGTLHDRDTQDV